MKVKDKVESRNELESYAYSLENQIGDKEKLGGKLSEEDKETVTKAVEEAISCLDSNKNADAEECKAQKKRLEDLVQPIVSKLYQGAGRQGGAPPPGGEGAGDEKLKDKDELSITYP